MFLYLCTLDNVPIRLNISTNLLFLCDKKPFNILIVTLSGNSTPAPFLLPVTATPTD